MTGEGVEAIIVLLVIVFAIFHMVRKKSREGLDEAVRRSSTQDSNNADNS